MITTHQIVWESSTNLAQIPDGSIHLTVTSPPYPMISMWDEVFIKQNHMVAEALASGEGDTAFQYMHEELDKVWREVYRVTAPGGIICINIGDATRTLNQVFKLYSNHSRILSSCLKLGLSNLPNVLWRKPTNAPTKFMGSGMMPPGAYVTLEHEHILIFRKGRKRVFDSEASQKLRRESAFFWEERNKWFSDIWDLKGTSQNMPAASGRSRSGAFPFEIAYRLINMFSVKRDTVLDPFLGTGTTAVAAAASGRNSIGYELDGSLSDTISRNLSTGVVEFANDRIRQRFGAHLRFVEKKESEGGVEAIKYKSQQYDFPVLTKQEVAIQIDYLRSIEQTGDFIYKVEYFAEPTVNHRE